MTHYDHFEREDELARMTARQEHIVDEQYRMEQEARREEQADNEPFLCRTCHDPIDDDGDEDHDQCLECRLETP